MSMSPGGPRCGCVNPMDRVYAREPFVGPRPWVFLAGPTPRNADTPTWRDQAKELYPDSVGTYIIPEDEDFGSFDVAKMDEQVAWEWEGLDLADSILFWVPRNMDTLPGMTTNVEFGMYAASGKCVLGFPEEAEHCGYMERLAHRYGMTVTHTLWRTVMFSIGLAQQRSADV